MKCRASLQGATGKACQTRRDCDKVQNSSSFHLASSEHRIAFPDVKAHKRSQQKFIHTLMHCPLPAVAGRTSLRP